MCFVAEDKLELWSYSPSPKHWDYRLILPYLVFQVVILGSRKGTKTSAKGVWNAKVGRWELRVEGGL